MTNRIIFDLIDREKQRQLNGIELIASENFVSEQVLKAMGSVLTNKYAEGLPGRRYYGGCEIVDEIEQLAIDRACELFGAEWANVQPHSGAQANAAVMLATLNPGDTILGFDLSHGGHLTHGSPVNFSGKLYHPVFYGVDRQSERVDYDEMEKKARAEKPKMIICGASAYSRDWDYERFRKVADEVGAILLADFSHPAGLIAAGLLNDPLKHCHVVTTTTHKTLRGPRGGLIMIGKDFDNFWGIKTQKGKLRKFSSLLDSGVFPGTQGGPLEHVIAAKAVAFGEALQPGFTDYCKQVISNAQALAARLIEMDYHIISDGTDNHSMLLDLRNKNITGKDAENALVAADVTVNKNMVPFDDQSPFVTSGIRLGAAALTTRGFTEKEMQRVADIINKVLTNANNSGVIEEARKQVEELTAGYPLFSERWMAK